jgi:GNAT superfamily N-acetyltransferase
MLTMMKIETVRQLAELAPGGGISPLGEEEFAAHGQDEHWVALASGGTLAARCSLWWHTVPHLTGERPGIIGHFAAADAASAAALLSHCCGLLAGRGCTTVIGPMDGNTWRRYRFVTRRGTEPPFFMEPDNPDEYPAYFEEAGFSPLARYFSNLDPDLGWSVPESLQQRLERRGIRIRQFDPDDFTGELEKIYGISIASFSNNFLYSPISRDGFLAMYTRVRSAVQPELVLFAEYQDKPVGFVFAIGDLLSSRAGTRPDTVIIKSLAVLPEWNGKGIGPLLMSAATASARALGYRRGIHALMHEANRSRGLSGHHGDVMREYTLYGRRLP